MTSYPDDTAAIAPTNAATERQWQTLNLQLERMRAMLYKYSELFYKLIASSLIVIIALALASMTETWRAAALIIPFFTIYVGVQSAYFLSYVVLARIYATGLEQSLNHLLGGEVLIAHRWEAHYLFPLRGPQFAGVEPRSDQTFIGFITIHFWFLGAGVILLSAYRAWQLLPALAPEFPPVDLYFPALIFWSLFNLVYLLWYFGTRRHERRVMQLVTDAYGTDYSRA